MDGHYYGNIIILFCLQEYCFDIDSQNVSMEKMQLTTVSWQTRVIAITM